MKSELLLDFCFIRPPKGGFKQEVSAQLQQIFGDTIHWFLNVQEKEDMEVVIAEVRGMGPWKTEQEVLQHIEANGTTYFWQWLHGYRMKVYPKKKGCECCGTKSV